MIPQSIKTLTFGAAFSALLAGGALAQTAPGTVVTNTISLTFNSGADTPTVTLPTEASHTAVFNVDRKIDLGVTAQAAAGQVSVVPGQEAVVLPFEVRNRGNGTQGFVIEVADDGTINTNGLAYSATATTALGSYYVMISPDIGIANGTIYDVGAGANAGNLAPGGSYFVLIVANVPLGATDGQFDDFTVTATATTADSNTAVLEDRSQPLTGVNTVFADGISTSTRTGTAFANPVDINNNGRAVDETRLLVNAPVLTATKEVAVLAENIPGQAIFNCATGGTAISGAVAAIPGACVEYTITVTNSNTATTAATTITVRDPIPANTTYAGISVDDFTSVVPNGAMDEVTAILNTLAIGGSASFRVRVLVD